MRTREEIEAEAQDYKVLREVLLDLREIELEKLRQDNPALYRLLTAPK